LKRLSGMPEARGAPDAAEAVALSRNGAPSRCCEAVPASEVVSWSKIRPGSEHGADQVLEVGDVLRRKLRGRIGVALGNEFEEINVLGDVL
jgi:hypothetical protein